MTRPSPPQLGNGLLRIRYATAESTLQLRRLLPVLIPTPRTLVIRIEGANTTYHLAGRGNMPRLQDTHLAQLLPLLARPPRETWRTSVALGIMAICGTLAAWRYSLAPIFFIDLFVLDAILMGAIRLDQIASELWMLYDQAPAERAAWATLDAAFAHLASCPALWELSDQAPLTSVADQKRNAGANERVSRWPRQLHRQPPRRIRTSVPGWTLPILHGELCFLPDGLLLRRDRQWHAVSYLDLGVTAGNGRYVEPPGSSARARVVGTTWTYANLDGSRDKRYKRNPALDIVLYGELTLSAPGNLHLVLLTEQPHFAQDIASALQAYQGHLVARGLGSAFPLEEGGP